MLALCTRAGRSSVRFARRHRDNRNPSTEHASPALMATRDSGIATMYDDVTHTLDNQRYEDPLYGILGETSIDRYFAARKPNKRKFHVAGCVRGTIAGVCAVCLIVVGVLAA